MPATGRLFVCARCRAQVIVCRRCDRGQIYCDGDCSELSRQASVREAGQRYQRSRHGRFAHAERMRRYRSRQNKVTHQGSAVAAADALLAPTSTTSAAKATAPDIAAAVCLRIATSANAPVRASYALGHCVVGFLHDVRTTTH